jgi:hypothetical protein
MAHDHRCCYILPQPVMTAHCNLEFEHLSQHNESSNLDFKSYSPKYTILHLIVSLILSSHKIFVFFLFFKLKP